TDYIPTYIITTHTYAGKMKIVEEPNTFGLNNPFLSQGSRLQPKALYIFIISLGAYIWFKLYYLFEMTSFLFLFRYKYEFCPFHNITQHEQSFRWNAYSGILGIWHEWEIVNNTFTGMWMRDGDTCGTRNRETKVILVCGSSSKLSQVSEPSTCLYSITFETPLVCHPHSLLVYPTLSEKLQKEWDEAEQVLYEGLVTEQGYKGLLKDIFEEAGLLKSHEVKASLPKAKADPESPNSLQKCKEDYEKQSEELERLRALLTQHNIPFDSQQDKDTTVTVRSEHLRGDTGLIDMH
uniref:N-acetylglucosamine-1-phosphate transferase subunit gamma n=1 Tax=Oryzias latipes TaxID=8090 RepID=A0A3B3HQE8_ORYLA